MFWLIYRSMKLSPQWRQWTYPSPSKVPTVLILNQCQEDTAIWEQPQWMCRHMGPGWHPDHTVPASDLLCSSHQFFTASDLASITSHIHNWVLFLLWLHPFILSGVISPLISRNILGTYWPGELLFQCPIFLPFHIVYGVLKARILKWFAIPLSSVPHFVRTLQCDPSVLGGPTWHGS